jgi:E3 ubiquitin-protein ligase BAH
MKFGQEFEATLGRGEYPEEWVNSAISYKKLKKCIKRVQQELLSLGLDKDTLDALWSHVGSSDSAGSLKYTVDDGETISFAPKLTISIDPCDGTPMDAWLSTDTRRVLQCLARNSNGQARRRSEVEVNVLVEPARSSRLESRVSSPSAEDDSQLQLIDVPLTADSEFFQTLRDEIVCLDDLQEQEHTILQDEITQLGKELRVLRSSRSKKSKREIDTWRRIFELYSDAEVFLSSHEADAGARNAAQATKQLQYFTDSLAKQQKEQSFRLGPAADGALSRFLRINVKLLRLLKFQEINRIALSKILKKFDKRTALHMRSSLGRSFTKSSPFMAQDVAKATCFTINEEVLSVIPQLNDYLCPICFSISWRPIRLLCNHVFCIRCMIVMQRDEKDRCPLCREKVVMEATEKNIDEKMVKFLEKNFKKDVKEKQKQNEIAAGIDRWGAAYEHCQSSKCAVM